MSAESFSERTKTVNRLFLEFVREMAKQCGGLVIHNGLDVYFTDNKLRGEFTLRLTDSEQVGPDVVVE